MFYKKIGIVIADEDEYAPFVNGIKEKHEYNTPFKKSVSFKVGGSEVFAVCCGIGKVNAASAAMLFAERGCDAIINFGLSGGLSGVRRGQFILPERFVEHDFDLTALGYKPCEKPGQVYIYEADENLIDCFGAACGASRAAVAVCGDRFVNDRKTRDYLIDVFAPSSCDMETAAIASVCHITGIPFASLRRISDDASDAAADSYDKMNKTEGKTLVEAFTDCLYYICGEV